MLESSKLSYLHDEYLDDLANGSGYTNYLNALETEFNGQGMIKESFSDARVVKSYTSDRYSLIGLTSKRRTYPSVMTKQTFKNYKTGLETSTITEGFDFFSGEKTRTISENAYQNVFAHISEPAYKHYAGMGLGMYGGKNMLSQEAASYTYRVLTTDHNHFESLVSASVQTWSDQVPTLRPGEYLSQASPQTGIWRKHSIYSFVGRDDVPLNPDGFYPNNTNHSPAPFDAWHTNDEPSQEWRKDNEITLYDVNSNMLEVKDVNENYAATRMSFDRSKIMATAVNAEYREIGYSGAEERPADNFFGNEVFHNSNNYTSAAHTGQKALVAQPQSRGFTFYMAPKQRTYRVSVWSSRPSCSIKYKFDFNNPENVATVTNKGHANGWYLLEADIPVTDQWDRIEIWCAAGTSATSFDDFRVVPFDAAMTSYVYNEWGELSHILDNNNLYTKYEYDGMGRLKATYRESFQRNYGNAGVVQTGTVNYHYGINNPFTVNITASRTGSTGSVLPAGIVSVKQGGTQTFEIQENCIDAKLQQVHIDGRKLNMNQMSTTLADGTVVQVSGRYLTFKNVQSPHSLSAQFGVSTVLGTVECLGYDTGNGNICYEGEYRYAYFNDCGEPINWVTVATKQGIPADLRPLAVDNCCTYNNPNTTCNCHH